MPLHTKPLPVPMLTQIMPPHGVTRPQCVEPYCCWDHYSDIIMSVMASQITSLTIVYPNVFSGADQIKHQSSTSLAFVRGIHRWPVNSLHKWPVIQKMFPFDDIIVPEYSVITRSVPWLLMPWLRAPAGHLQLWYWLCQIKTQQTNNAITT